MAGSGGSAEAGRSVISLLRPEDGMGSGVERVLVRDPSAHLESPSVAPDGRSVVVVRAPLSGGVRGDLARDDLATGALLGVLTNGGADAAPSVSPDGRSVAFDRDGAIWAVPRRAGAPGAWWPAAAASPGAAGPSRPPSGGSRCRCAAAASRRACASTRGRASWWRPAAAPGASGARPPWRRAPAPPGWSCVSPAASPAA
jgi:hypothetical protein